MHVIEAQTNSVGLIPEQIWDSTDLPECELFNGHPSGSAMPRVRAHAEYIKLLRSLNDKVVFDMPPQTMQRYRKNQATSKFVSWRFNHKVHDISLGKLLRIETLSPASIKWGVDGL